MTQKLQYQLLVVLLAVITGLRMDFKAYKKAQKADPSVKFDWAQTADKVGESVVIAVTGLIGVNAATPE